MFTRISRSSRFFGRDSSPQRPAVGCRRRLFEPLEPRQLLAADLAATLINIAPDVNRGTRQSADLVISNIGDATARGRASIPIYAVAQGANFDPLTSRFLAVIRPRLNLAPGESVTIHITPRVSRALAAGTYELVAAVATTNKFNETDLTNNIATSDAFAVNPSGTDISATIINLSPAVFPRSRQTGFLVITNNGTTTARGRISVPIFAVEQGSTFDPSTARALTTLRPNIRLAPGASVTIPLSVTLSRAITTGNFQLVASPDVTNALNEANVTNNLAQSDFFTVMPRSGLTVNSADQLATNGGTLITDANGNTFTAVNAVSNGAVLLTPNNTFLTTASGNTIPSTVNRTVLTNSNGTVLTDSLGNPLVSTSKLVNGTLVTTVSPLASPFPTISSLNSIGSVNSASTSSPFNLTPTNFTGLTLDSLNLAPTSAASTSSLLPTSLNIVPVSTGITPTSSFGTIGQSSLFPTNLNTFPILSGTSAPASSTSIIPVSTTNF